MTNHTNRAARQDVTTTGRMVLRYYRDRSGCTIMYGDGDLVGVECTFGVSEAGLFLADWHGPLPERALDLLDCHGIDTAAARAQTLRVAGD